MKETKPSARRPRTAAAKTAAEPAKKPASPAKGAPAAPRTDRHVMVATAAYYRAERRGFAPGQELEDWFAAEAELATEVAPAPATKPRTGARKSTG